MNNELGIRGGEKQSFKDLHAWQEGHTLVLQVYAVTKRFPKEELFALTSQIRRCVVSITSNIADLADSLIKKRFNSTLLLQDQPLNYRIKYLLLKILDTLQNKNGQKDRSSIIFIPVSSDFGTQDMEIPQIRTESRQGISLRSTFVLLRHSLKYLLPALYTNTIPWP